MKKKFGSKLSLHRETLQSLEGSALRVAGGETQAVACYTQPASCAKVCTNQLSCAATCTTTHTTTTTTDTL